MTNLNRRNWRAKWLVLVSSCLFLIVISIATFIGQIPTISKTSTIYDDDYINALKEIAKIVPQNETLVTNDHYPQVTYFTDHKTKIPWGIDSEKLLVEFMKNFNSSYLLMHEPIPYVNNNKTPLLVQLFGETTDKLSLISAAEPSNKLRSFNFKNKVFDELFENVSDFKTESSIIHLFHLRTSITSPNVSNW